MTPAQWFHRVVLAHQTLPHGERPTSRHVRVAKHASRWQHAEPSHGQLARAAGVHRNTVGNAMRRFRQLGLLTWVGQVVRHRVGRFVVTLRGANRYSFKSSLFLLDSLRFPCCTNIVPPDPGWLDMTAALIARCAAIA